jgi:hypothetical protein
MDEIPDLSSNRRFHSEANANRPTSESIEEQLARILKSEAFAGSVRLRAFLEFTVRQHLKGNAEALKEYSIALEVFRKPPTYDPSIDSTVRSAATRLREKLRIYYAGDGQFDPILIDFPGGHYIPRFTPRLPNPEQKQRVGIVWTRTVASRREWARFPKHRIGCRKSRATVRHGAEERSEIAGRHTGCCEITERSHAPRETVHVRAHGRPLVLAFRRLGVGSALAGRACLLALESEASRTRTRTPQVSRCARLSESLR